MTKSTHTLNAIEAVTDSLADAWEATSALAHDLASGAVESASGLGSAASSGLSEGADRVAALYEQARKQVRPPRRRFNPWPYVALVAVALIGLGWWRRRRAADVETSEHQLNPVVGATPSARAAAGH